LYCAINGDCQLNSLNVTNLTYSSISLINASKIIDEHWVNETTENGNQTFVTDENDIELWLLSALNRHSYLYFMETSTLGFRLWYDGSGFNTFKFDAIDGAGNIVPQMWFDRDSLDIDFFSNVDMNDNNISNVQCIEVNNKQICDFDAINITTSEYVCINSTNITCYEDDGWHYGYNGTTGGGTTYIGGDNISIVGNVISINKSLTAGSSVSFGNLGEIPQTNAATNDYDYSALFSWKGIFSALKNMVTKNVTIDGTINSSINNTYMEFRANGDIGVWI